MAKKKIPPPQSPPPPVAYINTTIHTPPPLRRTSVHTYVCFIETMERIKLILNWTFVLRLKEKETILININNYQKH